VAPLTIARLDSAQDDFFARLTTLTSWQEALEGDVSAIVETIVSDVAARGDAAVLEYTARFDRLEAATVAELKSHRRLW
jgi:histidinol dehydrogenase